MNLIAQIIRHRRAGLRPEHALRLVLLNVQISKLKRRATWEA